MGPPQLLAQFGLSGRKSSNRHGLVTRPAYGIGRESLELSSGTKCALGKSSPDGQSPERTSLLRKAGSSRGKERIMDFLAQNWFYIVVLFLFVVMHLLSFGCGDAERGPRSTSDQQADDESSRQGGMVHRP